MTDIGGAWLKRNEEKGYHYYSINFDDAILPLTIDKDKKLLLRENKNKKDNEKAPDMTVIIYKPGTIKQKELKNSQEPVSEEEICF